MAAEARKSFLLRIDPALWAEIERWAAEDLRSVNGQIEFVLREAVRRRRGGGGGAVPAVSAPVAGATEAAAEKAPRVEAGDLPAAADDRQA